ncbi:inovirus Gp2 family protein [Pseudomonas fluorescens]|uniref:inovirus Gp2 family protein n=1 Tax=Pseudomonas sp. NBRC 111138 TaxID=1661053 RepID=UPI0006D47BE9|nr:inovirus Gp2 family protein [Pseudomonas sp. NBRC 111138]QQU68178.1 inovirus Gp2 family protein [Pseudomonas fluorescens]
MIRNPDNTSCQPLRHPDNTNLHLHYDDTFEGLPVMIEKGPFIREYLSSLKETIELAIAQYPRVLAFRADLRLPRGIDLPDYANTNQVISKFFESFRRKIQYHQEKVRERNQYARDCKVRYVWSREVGQGGKQHYHVLILLNRDAYYTMGRLGSERANMISRMEEAWAGAMGMSVNQVRGLVHIPESAEYRIDRYVRGGEDELPALFCRASYLCKAATKSYRDRQRGFDTSRG